MSNLVALQQLLLSQNTPVVFNYGGIAFNLSATNKILNHFRRYRLRHSRNHPII